MSFSPDALRKHLSKHGSVAKPSLFRVTIHKPTAVGARRGRTVRLPGSAGYDLRFQCESTELPALTINTSEAKIYGPSWHVATVPVFNEIQLTFICAQDMWEKEYFDNWMHQIVPIANYREPEIAPHAAYRDTYTAVILIEQMTEVNSVVPIYGYALEDAFPIQMAGMPLQWGDSEGVHRLIVTFKYTKWKQFRTALDLNEYALQSRQDDEPSTEPPPVITQDGPISIPEPSNIPIT